MLFNSIVVVAALAGAVAAQTNYTFIDPNVVDDQTKASWCIGQTSGCTTLCDQNPTENRCDPTLLTYSCLCSNGTSPDLKDYKNTLPDYICQESFALCIKGHPDDALGQAKCKKDIQSQCGFLNVANYTSSSSASVSSSAGTSGSTPTTSASGGQSSGTGTGTATAAATSASKSAGAAMLSAGQSYGAGIIVTGLLAAFGYML